MMPHESEAEMPLSPTERISDRLMWIGANRIYYAGLLGIPTTRTMGSITIYAASEGAIQVDINNQGWVTTKLAVVQPFVPHRVRSESRIINVIKIEAESIDPEALPEILKSCGAVDAPWLAERILCAQREIGGCSSRMDILEENFDQLFFGQNLKERIVDCRIQRVIAAIKGDPSSVMTGEQCARMIHLSCSRFLHLFRQEVGVPFRTFRTWKQARNLLYYVTSPPSLAWVALETGYPDSAHFSNSIRHVYGLRPKDIISGSKKLRVHAAG